MILRMLHNPHPVPPITLKAPPSSSFVSIWRKSPKRLLRTTDASSCVTVGTVLNAQEGRAGDGCD